MDHSQHVIHLVILISFVVIFTIILIISTIIISRTFYHFNCLGCKTRCTSIACYPCCPKAAINRQGLHQRLMTDASDMTDSQQPTVGKPIRYTAAVSMTFFVLCILLCFLWAVSAAFGHKEEGYHKLSECHGYGEYCDIVVLAYLLYYCGHITLYILFMFRLYHSFAESVYSLHRSVFICLIVLIALVMMGIVLYIIDITVDIGRLIWNKEMKAFEFTWFIFFGIDIVLSALIMVLFTSRLQMIVRDHRRMSRMASRMSGISFQLDSRQLKFVELITKYTTLACISMASTSIACIVGIIEFVSFHQDYAETAQYTLPMMCLDCFVSLLCLYFNFAFAGKHYRKYCGCCNRNCRKLCVRVSTADYNKEIQKLYMSQKYLRLDADDEL